MDYDQQIEDIISDLTDMQSEYHLTTSGYTKVKPFPPGPNTHWGKGEAWYDAATIKLEDLRTALKPEPEPEPPPPTTILERYGIANGYTILTRSPADRQYELDRCVEAGAKWVRFDCTANDQAKVDACCADAFARDLTVMLILHGTTRPITATMARDFAKAMGQKWKGKPVVFEFCNEPDAPGQPLDKRWTGTQYGTALQGCWNGLKEANPDAKLLAGAIFKCWTTQYPAGNMADFVEKMYAAGAKGHFDAFSVHLYDDPAWNDPRNGWHMTFGPGPNVRAVMDAHGDQALPIISTESGDKVTSVSQEVRQASMVKAQMADTRCESMAIYTMLEDPAIPGFGLLRPDRTKRPAWNSYVAAAS